MTPVAILVRGINALLANHRTHSNGPLSPVRPPAFPKDGETYRGAGLPDEHRAFYTVGKKYRVPGFLATSFKEDVAKRFARSAYASNGGGIPAVVWVVRVDPEGKTAKDKRCQNAALIENNTIVKGEAEYLFVPYSVFTVLSVEVSHDSTYKTPHRIVIKAADDNFGEDLDMPLAPWS